MSNTSVTATLLSSSGVVAFEAGGITAIVDLFVMISASLVLKFYMGNAGTVSIILSHQCRKTIHVIPIFQPRLSARYTIFDVSYFTQLDFNASQHLKETACEINSKNCGSRFSS